jgi:diguanylate cyclase (GGDEF)-like protein
MPGSDDAKLGGAGAVDDDLTPDSERPEFLGRENGVTEAPARTTMSAHRDSLHGEPSPDSEDTDRVLLIVMAGHDLGQIHFLDRQPGSVVLGREEGVEIQVLDAEASRRHAAIRYDEGRDKFFIRDLGSRNGTSVNSKLIEGEHALTVGDKIRLGASVLRLTLAAEPEAQYARKMYQVALRDGLTGAYNRRYLDERLNSEIAFARRHNTPLSLLLLDIDHFKNINDAYGHQAGDAVLRRFYELVAAEVRVEDVVGRYGGEEFAVLCRETPEKSAAILAERLRSSVATATFEHDGSYIDVTVSIGVAGTRENGLDQKDTLLRAADHALYRAKNAGRNCCRLASRPG